MASSTGLARPGKVDLRAKDGYSEKVLEDTAPRAYDYDETNDLKPFYDNTRRKLRPRHVQLIGIGGYVLAPFMNINPDNVIGPSAQLSS